MYYIAAGQRACFNHFISKGQCRVLFPHPERNRLLAHGYSRFQVPGSEEAKQCMGQIPLLALQGSGAAAGLCRCKVSEQTLCLSP